MPNLLGWEYEGLPSEDQCKELLLPHLDHLNGALVQGWDEWIGLPEDSRRKVSDMQRGGVVHDFIIDHAKGLLGNSPDVVLPDNLPFFAVFIGPSICVRFKKFRANYLVEPSTDMGRRYYNGTSIPHLSPERQRLSCGYVLDPTGNELLDLAITCQIRDEVVWRWSITPAALAAPEEHHDTVSPPQPEISLPTTIELKRAENGK